MQIGSSKHFQIDFFIEMKIGNLRNQFHIAAFISFVSTITHLDDGIGVILWVLWDYR